MEVRGPTNGTEGNLFGQNGRACAAQLSPCNVIVSSGGFVPPPLGIGQSRSAVAEGEGERVGKARARAVDAAFRAGETEGR